MYFSVLIIDFLYVFFTGIIPKFGRQSFIYIHHVFSYHLRIFNGVYASYRAVLFIQHEQWYLVGPRLSALYGVHLCTLSYCCYKNYCHVSCVYEVWKLVVFYWVPLHIPLSGNRAAVVTRKEQLYMGIHHLTKLWAEVFAVIFMLFVCLLRKVDPSRG
jgi:hypothetical protein